MLSSGYEAIVKRRVFVPTCAFCGVPVLEGASLCDECQLDSRERMLMLWEYLVRTIEDPTCKLPYTYRPLS